MKGQKGSVVRKGNSYFIKFRGLDRKQKMQGSKPGQGFKNREEAQARLHEVLSEINKGDYVELRTIAFPAFAEQWIADRNSIRGSTASAYGSIIRQNLVPHLGTLRVHEIRYNDVQRLVSKLATDLSVKSLHNAVTLLRVMLVGKKGPSAIKLGYIRHDPTKGVELPTKENREIELPTPEQVWKLIDTAQNRATQDKCAHVGQAVILVDSFTGLRRGEMLALKFVDIDWFAGEIVVKRAISKVQATDGVHKWAWELGPTKGRRTRRVGIGERIVRMLAELKQSAGDKEGFVFTPEMAGLTGGCSFIDPDSFDALIYRPIATAAELSHVRFHDLRHFFASMLIAQGESAKYVCDQMGHSGIQVTFDVYGHLFPQSRQEASSRLEQAMFAKRKDQLVEDLVEKVPQRATSRNAGKMAN
jgi:integrase